MNRTGPDEDDFDDPPERGSAWGRPGGDWAGMRPTMDNPLTWSLPILRVGGVTVRLHLLFLAFIIVQLSWAIVPSQQSVVDFKLTAIAMAVLVVVVLAHEFGHVLLCRLGDGTADEILMWPLGGLAACHPPHTPRAHFWTALGGLLVHVAILALAGPVLFLLTRDWNVLFPNPLSPLEFARDPAIARSMPLLVLYMVNALSIMVLAFNLLPMFPLDGGRLLHALLWNSKGWSGAMRICVRVGFVTGLALAAFGAIALAWPAVAVAALGLIACYQTDRQLAFGDDLLDFESSRFALDGSIGEQAASGGEEFDDDHDADGSAPAGSGRINGATGTNNRRPAAANEIDRILQKIADLGMTSLTAGERTVLERETERKRREG